MSDAPILTRTQSEYDFMRSCSTASKTQAPVVLVACILTLILLLIGNTNAQWNDPSPRENSA